MKEYIRHEASDGRRTCRPLGRVGHEARKVQECVRHLRKENTHLIRHVRHGARKAQGT